jgi:hypothetical protein
MSDIGMLCNLRSPTRPNQAKLPYTRKPLGMSLVGSSKDGKALGALGLAESIVDIVGREG